MAAAPALAAAESEIEGGLSPRVSPFADLRDAAGLLQRAGFAMPVADSETIDVEYESALALMRDLGAMGEGQPGRRAPPRLQPSRHAAARRGDLRRALRHCRPAGSRPRFEVLFLHGWAPAPSQPKPLKPGSAAHRLAEALGTTERSAGEKAGR